MEITESQLKTLKSLVRALRMLGALWLIFGILALFGTLNDSGFLNRSETYAALAFNFVVSSVFGGILSLALANGFSRQERWAYTIGIVGFAFSIVVGLGAILVSINSGMRVSVFNILPLIIPALFLFYLVRLSSVLTKTSISRMNLSLWTAILCIIVLVTSEFFLLFRVLT